MSVTTLFAEPENATLSKESVQVPAKLGLGERLRTALQLAWLRVKEYLQFDASLVHHVGATAAGWLASCLVRVGQYRHGFDLLAKLHRGAFSPHTTIQAEDFVRTALRNHDLRLTALLNDFVNRVPQSAGTANFFADPSRMLGTAVLVLKSPSPNQKGVITMWYNHVFPLFARFYDLRQIAEHYHLVLEPSWSGCCDPNLLPFTLLRHPVFVQAIEPHDVRFLSAIGANLVAVPTAFNWWVDHRKLRPLPTVEKEFDVVMMAGWGSYKRHYRFFEALARLRRQGHRLKVLLLGYSVGWSKETILTQAEYYGIRDQLELRDSVPYSEVNEQLNRAKVHVLWARREGVNRAIVEAMFAGLPSILREGFNYGFHYPYINDQTGCYSTERDLPGTLLEVVATHKRFSPREWVMENLTCQHATARLSQAIDDTVGDAKGSMKGQIAAKINELHSMRYFDESLRCGFQSDYDFLRTTIRSAR